MREEGGDTHAEFLAGLREGHGRQGVVELLCKGSLRLDAVRNEDVVVRVDLTWAVGASVSTEFDTCHTKHALESVARHGRPRPPPGQCSRSAAAGPGAVAHTPLSGFPPTENVWLLQLTSVVSRPWRNLPNARCSFAVWAFVAPSFMSACTTERHLWATQASAQSGTKRTKSTVATVSKSSRLTVSPRMSLLKASTITKMVKRCTSVDAFKMLSSTHSGIDPAQNGIRETIYVQQVR